MHTISDKQLKAHGEQHQGAPMADFFPVVELKGSPSEIGYRHGTVLTKQIRANLNLYFDMIKGMSEIDPEQCLLHAAKFIEVLERDAPQLLEEMQAIAEGAGVCLEDIVFLNARTELISMGTHKAGAGECTAIGFDGGRTANGRPLIAQNWDWHEDIFGTAAIFRLEPAQGPRALFLAEAGQVGKIGFNEYGTGVLLNLLVIEKARYGLPVHVMLRMVLETRDMAEAVSLVKNAKRGGASHFLIGDEAGHLKGLELTPDEVAEIDPQNGAVIHTNHYCDAKLAEKDIGRLLMMPSTADRLDRARSIIDGRDQWNSEYLMKLFSDHDKYPASICRHVNPSDPYYLHTMTVASLIIDLAARKMLVSRGQPCQTAYRELSLN
jgi:isopenicillin-N N-acyltransferase-like protein